MATSCHPAAGRQRRWNVNCALRLKNCELWLMVGASTVAVNLGRGYGTVPGAAPACLQPAATQRDRRGPERLRNFAASCGQSMKTPSLCQRFVDPVARKEASVAIVPHLFLGELGMLKMHGPTWIRISRSQQTSRTQQTTRRPKLHPQLWPRSRRPKKLSMFGYALNTLRVMRGMS